MKYRILRLAAIVSAAAALFYSGCDNNGANSDIDGGGDVDNLIERYRGTNDPKLPDMYTLKADANPKNGGTVSKSPDKAQYAKGESVMLTAKPTSGYRFTGWTGSQSSSDASMTVTMNDNKNIVANFMEENVVTHKFTITAAPKDGGTVSKSPDQPEYKSGDKVYVTAVSASGYRFVNWSGSESSNDSAITVTMNGDMNLTANFAPQTYTLAINANPSYGGSVSSNPGKSDYTYNEKVTVTAEASSGYEFTGWSGASTSTSKSVTITIDGNKELTANFRQLDDVPVVPPTQSYTLTANPSPTNGGTVSWSPYKTSYSANEQVTVTATPNSEYRFIEWSGASSSTSDYITLTMNSNLTLTANFELIPPTTYTLTINATNGGIVYPSAGITHQYETGTRVTITATPNSGYRFIGWSGASSSTSDYITLTMNSDLTLTANFELITYTVTFISNGGSGAPPAAQTVNAGSAVILPSGSGLTRGGYRFDGWNTSESGTGTNYSVGDSYTPTGSVTLYARWDVISGAEPVNSYRDPRWVTGSDFRWENGSIAIGNISLSVWDDGTAKLGSANGQWFTSNNFAFVFVPSSGSITKYAYIFLDDKEGSLISEKGFMNGGYVGRIAKKAANVAKPAVSGLKSGEELAKAQTNFATEFAMVDMENIPASKKLQDSRLLDGGANYGWFQDNTSMAAAHHYRKDIDPDEFRFTVNQGNGRTVLAAGEWFTVNNTFLRVTHKNGYVAEYLYTIADKTFYHNSFIGYERADFRMFEKISHSSWPTTSCGNICSQEIPKGLTPVAQTGYLSTYTPPKCPAGGCH